MQKKGLTLLEIIVATMILSLVMAGLANVFFAAKMHILHARSRMAGGELGKYFLEPLSMQVRQDEWGSNCLSSGVGCDTSPVSVGALTYAPSYNITDVAGTTLRKVRLTLTWEE